MDTRATKLVTITALAVGLLATSGLAAYYRQRAAELQSVAAQAREETESLKHQLLLKQPNAPNVVLNLEGPAREQGRIGERRLEFDDEEPGGTESTNNRVQELEAALQAKERQLAALQERSTNRPSGSSEGQAERANRMEELKRTDPARYQELVDRREAARKEMRDAFARQAAHLMEEEVADATEAQQAQRQAMLQLVADTWQMAEQLYSDVPTSNRWDVVHTMRQNIETLTPMLESERNRALSQLALESGYTAQDSAIFVDYVNQVYESTSTRPLIRTMRRAAHGGRGMPPSQPMLPGQPPVTR